jgi:hypothetical protein
MKPPAIIDPLTLPMILRLNDMAAVYRLAAVTIRKAVQAGTFPLRPWDTYPYRWRRDDVLADLKRPRPARHRSPHGFASTRRRQVKATLTPRPKRSAG